MESILFPKKSGKALDASLPAVLRVYGDPRRGALCICRLAAMRFPRRGGRYVVKR